MIFSVPFANSSLTQAVGWALIHSFWQGLLLALILWSVLAVSRSARVRYAAGLTAMALMLTMFVATLAFSVPETMPDSPDRVMDSGASVLVADSTRIAPAPPPGGMNLLAPYLSLFWVTGVCACHLWQVAGLFSMRRLRRRGAWTAMEQWQLALGRLAQVLGITRSAMLFESVVVNSPVVVGHLRPLILVPAGLLARLPLSQVEAILLHELAHIRRCDYIMNLMQRWVEGLFFYHPAMWWMSRVVRSEREACCDDIAAEACGNCREYAGALAALEELRFTSQNSPALAATGGSLQLRIDRLLRDNPPSGTLGVISSLTILAATSALAFAGWQANTTQNPPTAFPSPVQATPPWPYQKWLNEDVVYLISDVERTAFNRLNTDEERQMFIEQFWQRRESSKEEHYRRIAYANERFAAAIPGWKTDRGRIYIVWGPPYEIESHPSGEGGLPPYEMWRYRAVPGVRLPQFFTFANVDNSGNYKLQTADTAQPAVFNRIVRWTVVDPLNRFVTGLTQEMFALRENGDSKRITYFESPGTLTAVAVVSDADLPDLSTLPFNGPLIQTRRIEDAVARLKSSGATRKALIIVRGATAMGTGSVPGGIQAVEVDAAVVGRYIVQITNQYVAGYRSDSAAAEPELIVHPVPGLPPLRITSVN